MNQLAHTDPIKKQAKGEERHLLISKGSAAHDPSELITNSISRLHKLESIILHSNNHEYIKNRYINCAFSNTKP